MKTALAVCILMLAAGSAMATPAPSVEIPIETFLVPADAVVVGKVVKLTRRELKEGPDYVDALVAVNQVLKGKAVTRRITLPDSRTGLAGQQDVLRIRYYDYPLHHHVNSWQSFMSSGVYGLGGDEIFCLKSYVFKEQTCYVVLDSGPGRDVRELPKFRHALKRLEKRPQSLDEFERADIRRALERVTTKPQ